MPEPQFEDPGRRIIDFGLTEDDLGPRQPPTLAPLIDLGLPFPPGEAPDPRPLQDEPATDDPLPRADVLVVTWTVAEHNALADVLTPGVGRNSWYRYARDFAAYLPEIRNGAPARAAQRLGSYFPTRVADKNLLCVKSELHLNQDSVRTGDGTATLPVKRFFRQMIDEVKPALVITVGTAGATFPPTGSVKVAGMTCSPHELGDVMITRGAKFRLSQEFKNEPFATTGYQCTTFDIPTARLEASKQLLAVNAANLVEPSFGVPTRKYNLPSLVAGFNNAPDFHIDGRDFPEFHPMLTTDSFEFGTSKNGLEQHGCGVEMGDAVLGMVVDEMRGQGLSPPDWLVIRNASDPQINGDLPGGDNPAVPPRMRRALNMQAHWAVWYYEAYGYWTSVNSAIAAWAMTA
jgi:hypothetical protein